MRPSIRDWSMPHFNCKMEIRTLSTLAVYMLSAQGVPDGELGKVLASPLATDTHKV